MEEKVGRIVVLSANDSQLLNLDGVSYLMLRPDGTIRFWSGFEATILTQKMVFKESKELFKGFNQENQYFK